MGAEDTSHNSNHNKGGRSWEGRVNYGSPVLRHTCTYIKTHI